MKLDKGEWLVTYYVPSHIPICSVIVTMVCDCGISDVGKFIQS